MSDYWLQPEQSSADVVAELAAHGIEALTPGAPMDEHLDAHHLRIMVQIAMEHLGRLGGGDTGDLLTADMVNRGLLVYLQQRSRPAGRG